MNIPINFQTILKNGKPEYVVIPYQQFIKIFPKHLQEDTVPHAVISLMVDKNISRVRAWREYLQLTQEEVAVRLGVSQAALSQMEAPNTKLRKITLTKLAKALGITINQLY
jgi:DNA-binding XRE family transcriptional regulator